jgi:hypothetical protein
LVKESSVKIKGGVERFLRSGGEPFDKNSKPKSKTKTESHL